jgi:hypothetical protein
MTPNLGVVLFEGNSKVLPLIIRPLEDFEYQQFVTARSKLFEFSRRQDLFRLVYANYLEYKNALNEYFNIHCKKFGIDVSYFEDTIFNINRLVLNFLSAIRTFLDHAETYIKRTYGKESDQLKIFNNFRRSCYDTYFSYRFLYKLRNYSQHI